MRQQNNCTVKYKEKNPERKEKATFKTTAPNKQSLYISPNETCEAQCQWITNFKDQPHLTLLHPTSSSQTSIYCSALSILLAVWHGLSTRASLTVCFEHSNKFTRGHICSNALVNNIAEGLLSSTLGLLKLSLNTTNAWRLALFGAGNNFDNNGCC